MTRSIHAEHPTFPGGLQMVRDRGRWQVESGTGHLIDRVDVAEAARLAVVWWHEGGRINFDVPGGDVFDRTIRSSGISQPSKPPATVALTIAEAQALLVPLDIAIGEGRGLDLGSAVTDLIRSAHAKLDAVRLIDTSQAS